MKEIPKIKSGLFGRQLKLLRMGIGAGAKLLKERPEDLTGAIRSTLGAEVDRLVNELGSMKGPVMKMGQMLSLYSVDFLPPALQTLLSKLEHQSYFLSFSEIKKNIPQDFLHRLEIEETPLAAASLGQVHRARFQDKTLALKIQYKGVRRAIDSDLRTLRYLLKLGRFLPKFGDLDPLFEEVREMLYLESDYRRELEHTKKFKTLLAEYPEFHVPEVYPEFSTEKVIAFEFIEAFGVREASEKIPQEIRNHLGEAMLTLLFEEIFRWGIIQTDPNPGNFFLREDEGKWQWVLFDFGATKTIDESLKSLYEGFIRSVIGKDRKGFVTLLKERNYIGQEELSSEGEALLDEYLTVLSSPFTGGVYDWGNSDVYERTLKLLPRLMKEFTLKNPPKEVVFVDRKIGGLFFLLKLLKAQFDPAPVIENFLPHQGRRAPSQE